MKTSLIVAVMLLSACDLETIKSDTGGSDWGDVGDTDETATGEGCAGLFAAADGVLAAEVVGCIEGAFEESGYDFDAPDCDELENAWFLGSSTDTLWPSCQADEGFTDSTCDVVLTLCF